jgi:hypothetical protein
MLDQSTLCNWANMASRKGFQEGNEQSPVLMPSKAVRVICNRQATEAGGLSLRRGDMAKLLELKNHGWCVLLTSAGKKGYFPKSCIEPAAPYVASAAATFSFPICQAVDKPLAAKLPATLPAPEMPTFCRAPSSSSNIKRNQELQALSEGLRRELALRRELNESKMVNARLTDELEDQSKALQNKEKELQESKATTYCAEDFGSKRAREDGQIKGWNAKRAAQAISRQASLLVILHYFLGL